MSMFRIQHQLANQWVELTRSPLGPAARGLAEVRRTVAAEDPVRVVTEPKERGEFVNVVV